MSTCYEFALEFQLKSDVSQAVIETLHYMTRSQEYDFDTPQLGYPLFEETAPWKVRSRFFRCAIALSCELEKNGDFN